MQIDVTDDRQAPTGDVDWQDEGHSTCCHSCSIVRGHVEQVRQCPTAIIHEGTKKMVHDQGDHTKKSSETAGEAGWHVSRYLIWATVPGVQGIAVANLFNGTFGICSPLEWALLAEADNLPRDHPFVTRFVQRGLMVNYDERAALQTLGRAACAIPRGVSLTICPTMGCNFDCPYCFSTHHGKKMSSKVQDDVVSLAQRMLDASGAQRLSVTWFGGEPLLAPGVIESLSSRLISLVEQRGGTYGASIITNGYLLTQEVADMLTAAKVQHAQVTVDGIGAAHDATRHLADGAPTFDRVVANLRNNKLKFRVHVRCNVHDNNRGEFDALGAYMERVARASGNDIACFPALVRNNATADMRGQQMGLARVADMGDLSVFQQIRHFGPASGSFCGAHSLWDVGIDEQGRLHKCWEAVDKPALSFGNAYDWNPTDPIATAARPNNLTKFLNTALPMSDAECLDCIWLPLCVGGCPYRRLFESKACVAYKNDSQTFVRALYAHMRAQESARRNR